MLTSLQNPLVKQIRKLHQPKGRHEQQCFLLEGTHLVEAACAANCSLLTVCYTSAWQERYPALWQQVSHRAQRVELVSEPVIQALATTVEPDGVVATMARYPLPAPKFQRLGLVLETIQDPGNVGTMIRTAAAVGVDGILMSRNSADPDQPKVLRASAGQWFQMPIAVSDDLVTDVAQYRQQGLQVVATLPTASLTYWQVNFSQPTLILLGNEGAGLSSELASLADYPVRIPSQPGVESLNVAIAAALLLYEARRQWES